MCTNESDVDSCHESQPNIDRPWALLDTALHHEREAPLCVYCCSSYIYTPWWLLELCGNLAGRPSLLLSHGMCGTQPATPHGPLMTPFSGQQVHQGQCGLTQGCQQGPPFLVQPAQQGPPQGTFMGQNQFCTSGTPGLWPVHHQDQGQGATWHPNRGQNPSTQFPLQQPHQQAVSFSNFCPAAQQPQQAQPPQQVPSLYQPQIFLNNNNFLYFTHLVQLLFKQYLPNLYLFLAHNHHPEHSATITRLYRLGPQIPWRSTWCSFGEEVWEHCWIFKVIFGINYLQYTTSSSSFYDKKYPGNYRASQLWRQLQQWHQHQLILETNKKTNVWTHLSRQSLYTSWIGPTGSATSTWSTFKVVEDFL